MTGFILVKKGFTSTLIHLLFIISLFFFLFLSTASATVLIDTKRIYARKRLLWGFDELVFLRKMQELPGYARAGLPFFPQTEIHVLRLRVTHWFSCWFWSLNHVDVYFHCKWLFQNEGMNFFTYLENDFKNTYICWTKVFLLTFYFPTCYSDLNKI